LIVMAMFLASHGAELRRTMRKKRLITAGRQDDDPMFIR
jgi:hypothetical protein